MPRHFEIGSWCLSYCTNAHTPIPALPPFFPRFPPVNAPFAIVRPLEIAIIYGKAFILHRSNAYLARNKLPFFSTSSAAVNHFFFLRSDPDRSRENLIGHHRFFQLINFTNWSALLAKWGNIYIICKKHGVDIIYAYVHLFLENEKNWRFIYSPLASYLSFSCTTSYLLIHIYKLSHYSTESANYLKNIISVTLGRGIFKGMLISNLTAARTIHADIFLI